MRAQWTLLLTAGLGVAAPALPEAQAANWRPLVVSDPGGSLRFTLSLPHGCGQIDQTTPLSRGLLEITPGDTASGGARSFTVARADLAFAPFTISRSCLGTSVTREYNRVAVQLARAVTFTTPPSAPGIYPISIPPEDVLVYQDIVVNGSPMVGYRHPIQPLTGTVDLASGTIQVGVVFALDVHFSGVCFPWPIGCLGEADRTATLTAGINGRITFPDSDGDGVPDPDDNCPLTPNPNQRPVVTPVIIASPDVTLASCANQRIRPPFGAEICWGDLVQVVSDAPATFPPGRTVVTWTAADAQGRTAGDTQTVTVVDTTSPEFTSIPGDITMSSCGPADLGLPTATDDCGSSPGLTNNAPARFLVGRRVVTWTATDPAGNRATVKQAVTVTDTVPPKAACAPTSAPDRQGGVGFFKVTGTDTCGAPTLGLGSYALSNGETVHIVETVKPGVTLVDTVLGVRYFEVGPGEAAIAATDGSGNVSTVSCR